MFFPKIPFDVNQLSTLLHTTFYFSLLLIRGLIKGIKAIYSTLSVKMYCQIVHDSNNLWEEFLNFFLSFHII